MSITSRFCALALMTGLAVAVLASSASAADAKKRPAAKPAAAGESAGAEAAGAPAAVPAGQPDKQVDLNFALKNELMSLPGVDEETAAKIIEGRPYTNKTQLRQRNLISAAAFYAILDRITIDTPRLENQLKAEKERKQKEKERQAPPKDTGPKKKSHQGPVTLGPASSN